MRTNWKHKETGMWINGRYFAAMALMGAATLVTLALCAPAKAAFLDGNRLYERCQNNTAVALGYVIAVMDAMEYSSEQEGLCIPQSVNAGQLTDMVCNDLRDHPSIRHAGAALISYASISSVFSCQK